MPGPSTVLDVNANAAIVEMSSVSVSLGVSAEAHLRGETLEWRNLDFKVGTKSILSQTWGALPPKTMTAILGPSGAGKSSLLNVLAGRIVGSSLNKIDGVVQFGDVEINPFKYRKNIAYVMQDDALTPTATVRECLTFSASLRLRAEDQGSIPSKVEDMIKRLGLVQCADVRIGGELVKGISGGERKRTSIGVELITAPTLVFLDEPTSGLDSYSAFNIVQLLKEISHAGATVLMTIHQPSSEIYNLFDTMILMKSGHIAFQGPISDLQPWMKSGGHPLPANTNPADHAMFVVQINDVAELRSKGLLMDASKTPLRSPSAGSSGALSSTDVSLPDAAAPYIKQLSILFIRELQKLVRDKPALIGRFGITIFLNVLFGLIFWDAGKKDNSNATNFGNHFGAMTMVAISSMFGSAEPALFAFPSERPIFLREYSTGTYNIIPYFVSKVCIELPLSFAQLGLQWAIVFGMIKFRGSYILLLISSWLLGIVATSVAIMLGCLVKDVKQASELVPIVFVPQILFAGFFTRTEQIPIFLRWAQYLCSLKYSMNLLMITEFGSGVCGDAAESGCDEDDQACLLPWKMSCEKLLDANEVKEDKWWEYGLILLALFLLFRGCGIWILTVKAKSVY